MILVGCRRNNAARSLQAAKDYNLIVQNLSSVVPGIIHLTKNESNLLEALRDSIDVNATCGNIIYLSGDTTDISLDPIEFEIDYPFCKDADSVIRNGKIKITLFDYLSNEDAFCNVVFNDLNFDNQELEASFVLSRVGENEFNLNPTELFQRVGTRRIQYDADFLYVFTSGIDPNGILDDVLTVAEQGVLTDRNAKVYNITNGGITRDISCKWFSSGIVEMVDEDNATQVLDYSKTLCEPTAELKFEGDSLVVNLP